jgi:hypothetical protein
VLLFDPVEEESSGACNVTLVCVEQFVDSIRKSISVIDTFCHSERSVEQGSRNLESVSQSTLLANVFKFRALSDTPLRSVRNNMHTRYERCRIGLPLLQDPDIYTSHLSAVTL